MDMNAFFASVEQIDHPEFHGCQIGVTNGQNGTCIITSSSEARRFGNPGRRIWLMAQGEDPEQINTSVAPPKGLGHGKVMPPYTKDPDLIRLYLLHMGEKLAERLHHHNLVAQQFTIGLRNLHGWLGGKYHNSVPVSDGQLIYQLGLKMLIEHWRGECVHQVQITALNPRPAGQQRDLFQKSNTASVCFETWMPSISVMANSLSARHDC